MPAFSVRRAAMQSYKHVIQALSSTFFLRTEGSSLRVITLLAALAIATLPVCGQSVVYQAPITTVAGTWYPSHNGDGGPAVGAALADPMFISLDQAGNLYIAEYSPNNDIRVVNTETVPITVAGVTIQPGDIQTVAGNGGGTWVQDGVPAISTPLGSPSAVVVDSAGNLYIAVPISGRIRKVDVNGIITTVAGNGSVGYSGDGQPATSAALNNPQGVAIDKAGDLFIADMSNHVIREVNATTQIINTVVGGGTDCPADTDGRGDGCPALSAILEYPTGVTLDAQGDLYIADFWDNRVRAVNTRSIPMTLGGVSIQPGYIATVAGNGTAGDGADGIQATLSALNSPYEVSVDSAGNLYIPDYQNNRVQRVNASGVVSTVAGNGTGGFCCDGSPATTAEIWGPYTVAIDGGGNLLIADYVNARIRKVVNAPPSFSNVAVGSTSSSQLVSLSFNTTLTLSNVQTTGDFAAALTGSCNPGVSAPTTCTWSVNFTPTKAGTRWGALVATDSNGNNYSFGLQGIGVGSAAALTPGIIGTVVGNGTPCPVSTSACGDGGAAISADLYTPASVTLDSAGNLYISDDGDSRIRMVNRGTAPLTVAGVTIGPGNIGTVAGNGTGGSSNGTGQATTAELLYPFGVALDSAGNLYIADGENDLVRKVDVNGNISTFAGAGAGMGGGCAAAIDNVGDGCPAINAHIGNITGIAVDAANNVYLADWDDALVRKVDTNGIISAVAGNGTTGFNGESGAAASIELQYPAGMAFDSAGNLYFADSSNHRIRELSNGVLKTVAGSGTGGGYSGDGGPATQAQLSFPRDVAVDSAGNLYIADSGNDLIRKVDTNGIITTIAGDGPNGVACTFGTYILGDGCPATSAFLGNPQGLGVDSAGNVYIADSEDNRIRVVSGSTGIFAFGSLSVGQTSSPQSFSLSNVGNAAFSFNSIAPSSNFSIQSVGNDCAVATPLSIGATCAIGAVFAPTIAGNPLTGTVTVSDGATNSPQTISLTGIATISTPVITWPTLTPISYGTALSATQLDATANVAGTFSYVPPLGAVVSAGNDTLTVTFTPSSPGYTTATAYAPLTVSQAPLSVVVNSVTRPQGQSNPTLTGTVTGIVNNDVVKGFLVVSYSTTATASSPAGTYPITATISGFAAPSYALTVTQGTLTVTAAGVDFVESSFTAPATAGAGGNFTVSDTTLNQGSVNAAASSTGFYLSVNGTSKGTLLGSRSVPALASGASSGPVSTTLTLPLNLTGNYYFMACANYNNQITESNTANNCVSSPVTVGGADLIESSYSGPTSAASGGTIQVTDTTTDQGSGNAAASSTGFYLSVNGTSKGTLLGSRSVPALASGASSGPVSTTLTMPLNLTGNYYLMACANYNNQITESSTANNCVASSILPVAGADLIETAVSGPATATPGSAIVVTDTAEDQGGGNAGASTTAFYLSSNGTVRNTLLGTRSVPALTSGASSGPANTTLTLPTTLNGTYYIMVCANYGNAVTESNTSNNCTATGAIAVP